MTFACDIASSICRALHYTRKRRLSLRPKAETVFRRGRGSRIIWPLGWPSGRALAANYAAKLGRELPSHWEDHNSVAIMTHCWGSSEFSPWGSATNFFTSRMARVKLPLVMVTARLLASASFRFLVF